MSRRGEHKSNTTVWTDTPSQHDADLETDYQPDNLPRSRSRQPVEVSLKTTSRGANLGSWLAYAGVTSSTTADALIIKGNWLMLHYCHPEDALLSCNDALLKIQ